jgi:hypothetical protein
VIITSAHKNYEVRDEAVSGQQGDYGLLKQAIRHVFSDTRLHEGTYRDTSVAGRVDV